MYSEFVKISRTVLFILLPLHAARIFRGNLGRVLFLSENNDHIIIKISRYNPSENLSDDFNLVPAVQILALFLFPQQHFLYTKLVFIQYSV